MVKCYLSLGSNLGDSLRIIKEATSLIKESTAILDFKVSNFYETSAISRIPQPKYVNAVCAFDTSLDPFSLFQLTQSIEIKLGKFPKSKDSPRPIDIDLLFYDDQMIQSDHLIIPHPAWYKRLFVLIPLRDLISKIDLQTPRGMTSFEIDFLIDKIKEIDPTQIVSLIKE